MKRRFGAGLLAGAYSGSALAHVGAPAWHAPLGGVTTDPFVLLPLGLSAVLYVLGHRRLHRLRAPGPQAMRRCVAFAAGLCALLIALVWPLDPLDDVLFSVHMVQHVVLMNLAAPLLVLARPVPALFAALPRSWRRGIGAVVRTRGWHRGWRAATGLATAMVTQLAALWIWHLPVPIAASVTNQPLHAAMHASLLAAALLFWTAVRDAVDDRPLGAVLALAVTAKVAGTACIFLLLAKEPIYMAYGADTAAFGLTPIADQQLGWGVMMVAGGLIWLGAAAALTVRLLTGLESRLPSVPGPAARSTSP